jgi:predicted transcriptional regulator
MAERTVTLRSDLVDRLETIAEQQARSVDEVLGDLLGLYVPPENGNWALAVAEAMEAADIDWIDDPDASVNSREEYKRYLQEKWQRSQQTDVKDA